MKNNILMCILCGNKNKYGKRNRKINLNNIFVVLLYEKEFQLLNLNIDAYIYIYSESY